MKIPSAERCDRCKFVYINRCGCELNLRKVVSSTTSYERPKCCKCNVELTGGYVVIERKHYCYPCNKKRR